MLLSDKNIYAYARKVMLMDYEIPDPTFMT